MNGAEIGVPVKDGEVTLTGIVDTHTKKMTAERAAEGIGPTKSVAENMQVGVSPSFRKTDSEIAGAEVDPSHLLD